MQKYTIFENKADGDYIMHLLYKLTPEGVINNKPDGKMFDLVPLIGGKYAAEFDDEHVFIIHPKADVQILIDLYKLKGEISEKEELVIKEFVSKNSKATLFDVITPAIKEQFKTYEQLKAEGWFPSLKVIINL